MASGGGGESEMGSEVEEAKKRMFLKAMSSDWNAVVKDFEKYPQARSAKLTRSEDTALHLAVSDGQVAIVKMLVNLISSEAESDILYSKNDRGNTPLHLAAASGELEMCEYIAAKDPQLISSRNDDDETPLFLAACHGEKQAFLYLHSICPRDKRSVNGRKNNGETVLHCAITGEYFGLAFQIMHLYKDLAYFNTEKGITPLHLLAGKPSAFKSGSRLRLYDRIIYHCIFVDKIKEEFYHHDEGPGKLEKEDGPKCPENYGTCLDILKILKKIRDFVVKKNQRFSADQENPSEENRTSAGAYGGGGLSKHELVPIIYSTSFRFFKVLMKALLIILGIGITRISQIIEKKEKHTWAKQIMEELVNNASRWEYYYNGRKPNRSQSHKDDEITLPEINNTSLESADTKSRENSLDKKEEERNMKMLWKIFPEFFDKKVQSVLKKHFQEEKEEGRVETPILIAAKMGIVELVKNVLNKYPVAVQDLNADGKNIVLLAVENRQPYVYKFLLEKKVLTESAFRTVDNEGNSALHLAATLGEYRPWLIPGAALQMQWEIKWYQFVKDSKPTHYFARHNKEGRTPKEVFTESHKDLVKEGGEWLINTSESCSVVAALIATVAFATASTVPGGVKEGSGSPTLQGKPAFDVFAICSLVALCFSVTAVIVFLSILTSRFQEKDFHNDLPMKLILGLTSLFLSIASMLVSFCAGHFFVLKDELKFAAFPVYAVTCLPATYFAAVQFPLYFDLLKATFRKVPQRSYKIIRR